MSNYLIRFVDKLMLKNDNNICYKIIWCTRLNEEIDLPTIIYICTNVNFESHIQTLFRRLCNLRKNIPILKYIYANYKIDVNNLGTDNYNCHILHESWIQDAEIVEYLIAIGYDILTNVDALYMQCIDLKNSRVNLGVIQIYLNNRVPISDCMLMQSCTSDHNLQLFKLYYSHKIGIQRLFKIFLEYLHNDVQQVVFLSGPNSNKIGHCNIMRCLDWFAHEGIDLNAEIMNFVSVCDSSIT